MTKKHLIFVGIGFELVGIILAGLFLGKWLDENYGTHGLGIAAFPMLGLVGWIIHVVALTKLLSQSEDPD